MNKYDPMANYLCPKCGAGKNDGYHNVLWRDSLKITDSMDRVVQRKPDRLQVSCFRCGFVIGEYKPLDAVDPE